MLISQATDDFDADMLETRKSIRWCQKIEPQGIFELADPPFPESDKRCFGYSRNHRPNCVQIVIALVVTPDGLPLAYEVLPGNTSDKTTLRRSIVCRYGAFWPPRDPRRLVRLGDKSEGLPRLSEPC